MAFSEDTAAARHAKAALLVLGMHRSGTSAVTGMLDRLGIPAAGDLLPAESYNEKGIFENRAVNLFHNRLLDHLGSKWDDPIPVSNRFVDSAAGERFVAELATIVETELVAASPVFAVKDPRMCRFMPLWKAVLERLGIRPLVVVPLRHPVEVAGSLAARDRFPRAKSFLLWLTHILAAERETRGLARSFIGYDALLGDWRGTSDKLKRDLSLDWPKERARAENDVDAFLSRDLRHHDRPGAIGEGTHLDALVSRAWEALNALERNEADAEARQALGEIEAELDATAAVVGPYVAWEFRTLGEAQERVSYLEELERVLRAQNAEYFHEIGETSERLQSEHRREINSLAAQSAADAARLEWLEGEAARYMKAFQAEQAAHHAVVTSTFWRLSGPVRRMAGSLSPATRNRLSRAATAAWWTVTPWRMPARMQFQREREAAVTAAAGGSPGRSLASAPVSDIQRPLALFTVKDGAPRVSMVTDSINPGSLFGGVATALIFSALLAKRTGRRLRVVTRTQAPDAGNVGAVFRAHGIEWTDNIDFAFANTHDEKSEIDQYPDEWFVTTSWWSTHATSASVPVDRILYLLQEDERMFYAFGDNYLNCTEVMKSGAIRKIVNAELLYKHLRAENFVGADDLWFEPSFPERIYYPDGKQGTEKKNFFFYARPGNARNLYERGVEVIERAIEDGILDPADWDIYFVGKDLEPVTLAKGVQPVLLQNMPWEGYAAYVRSVDLALTLMYTPHPSYPPLDVAACGGVAVTNRFGVKTDLGQYSRAIICADSDVDSLVEGLKAGIERARDPDWRAEALAGSGLKRNWTDSFEPVFERLVEGDRLVR